MIKDSESMIGGKAHSEILSMKQGSREYWYKKISSEDKAKAMKIVETARQIKNSAAKMGENNPAKRPEVRAKISISMTGKNNPMYGKSRPEISERMLGENNPNFKNWASKEPYCQNWTEGVREHVRNLCNRTCTICEKSILQYFRIDSKAWSRLHVDHVDENKMQGCDDWEWRLTPLCPSCHGKMNKQKFPWHLLLQLLLFKNKKHQINFLFEDEIQ